MNYRYIIVHKPWGMLSQFTCDGAPGSSHRTLAELDLPKDIYPVGRLDKDSEGLLLLSNDGKFIKDFLDKHPRVYWAQVEGLADADQVEQLSKGVELKDGLTKKAQVKTLYDLELPPRNPPIRERKSIPTSWIELSLTEGKNRQVRRMTAAVGLPTLRLLRVGLGKIKLDLFKDLKVGEWMEIKKEDLI